MTVFGNSAIYLIMNQGATDPPIPFSRMLRLPCLISWSISVLFRAVIHCNGDGHRLLCNVADSGAMVVDTLASGGVANTPSGSEFSGHCSWALLLLPC